MTGHDGVLKIT